MGRDCPGSLREGPQIWDTTRQESGIKGFCVMVFVKTRDGEGIEDVLRRFKRECQRNGILKDLKRREHYTPPSVKKKLKKKEALRKLRRRRNRSARGRGYGKSHAPKKD